jgi:uncharacterized Zn finger protein (UPF0148 family)
MIKGETMKNKQLQEDINKNQIADENEQLTGDNCPVCGYPIVLEFGLEVCYGCGWFKDDEQEGYFEE